MRQLHCVTEKFLKYTINEQDNFYVFLAAKSELEIRFSPTHLDFAAREVIISRNQ